MKKDSERNTYLFFRFQEFYLLANKDGSSQSIKKSHLCEVSVTAYIWWFDKCHTNLSQSSDKEGGTHGPRTDKAV